MPVKQNGIAVDIVGQLKAAILSGRFTPGPRLPAEPEPTGQFQVSRVVAGETLRALDIKGLENIHMGPAASAMKRHLENMGKRLATLEGAYRRKMKE